MFLSSDFKGNSLPKPEQLSSYNPPGKYDARAFNLGFFAAIVIQGNGIDVDLNGFTLEQGVKFLPDP